MISLSSVNLRFARWVCSKLGHIVKKGYGSLIPLKVICSRCGDSVDLVGAKVRR